MPTKTTKKTGRQYEIDGRRMTWHADVDTDEEPFDISLPLRIKLKVIEAVGGDTEMDAQGMMKMLDLLIPGQSASLREMDINDFQEMFVAWQDEYEQLTGASLGESAGSSS